MSATPQIVLDASRLGKLYRQLGTFTLGELKLEQVKPMVAEEWFDGIKRARGAKAKSRNLMSALFTLF